MKTGYYISVNYEGSGYPKQNPCLEFGIYLTPEDVQNKIDQLHSEMKLKWENEQEKMIEKINQNIKKRQAQWDALNAVGLADNKRPELFIDLDKDGWYIGRENYYTFEEIKIHEKGESE